MGINWSQIIEGYRNKFIPPKELKETITTISEERQKICAACEYRSDNAKKAEKYSTVRPDIHCIKCGCNLDAKSKCLSCACPLEKWKGYCTTEEENSLKTELANDSN